MTQLAQLTRPRRGSDTRDSHTLSFVGTAFDTRLGWMALAHDDEILAGVVFGHATKRHAMEALNRNIERATSVTSAD